MSEDFFRLEEFACKDEARTPYPAARIVDGTWSRLRETLNTIRKAWNAPIKVVSGYRAPAYNARIGGAKKSQHMEGTAADIKPTAPHDDPRALHALILGLYNAGKLPHLGGLGEYNTFVHVDVRPRKANGGIAQWGGKHLED